MPARGTKEGEREIGREEKRKVKRGGQDAWSLGIWTGEERGGEVKGQSGGCKRRGHPLWDVYPRGGGGYLRAVLRWS